MEMFQKLLQVALHGREATQSLVTLQQGKRSVTDYAIEFCFIATDSGWNQSALSDAFFHGLSEQIKDYLTPSSNP